MICVALHDTSFNENTYDIDPTNNIIAAVSFRILPEASFSEETGVYIYYLGTLQNVSFHEVVETNGTMNDYRFPIENNGFGEFLLRLTQLLSLNIRDTYNMFLVANTTSSISKYYKKLKFDTIDWNTVGKNVNDCATLESKDLSDLQPMHLIEAVPFSVPKTRHLFLRAVESFPRAMRDIKTIPDAVYKKK